MMQGRALSRLHQAKGPDAPTDAWTGPVTSDDMLAAAKEVNKNTDLEAGRQAEEADRPGQDQQDSRRESGQPDGGKPVHVADLSSSGVSHQGSKEAEKKARLWNDMLKRKVGADMEKQKKNDGTPSSLQGEEDWMTPVDSQATLLDPTVSISDRVSDTQPPSHQPPGHLPALDQPKLLSKKGLMSALNISRRFKKSDGDGGKAAASGGIDLPGGGRLTNGMERAGSMDSNAPLLSSDMPSGQ